MTIYIVSRACRDLKIFQIIQRISGPDISPDICNYIDEYLAENQNEYSLVLHPRFKAIMATGTSGCLETVLGAPSSAAAHVQILCTKKPGLPLPRRLACVSFRWRYATPHRFGQQVFAGLGVHLSKLYRDVIELCHGFIGVSIISRVGCVA